jgi:hypothetical protein
MKVLFTIQIARVEDNIWEPTAQIELTHDEVYKRMPPLHAAQLFRGDYVNFIDEHDKRCGYRLIGSRVVEPEPYTIEISEPRRTYTVRHQNGGGILERGEIPKGSSVFDMEKHLFFEYGVSPICQFA